MSAYGLIKATSRIMRNDTINDLRVVNNWRYLNNLNPIVPSKPSVRQLENAVALAIEKIDIDKLPVLLRGIEFYTSLIPEITEKERKAFNLINC